MAAVAARTAASILLASIFTILAPHTQGAAGASKCDSGRDWYGRTIYLCKTCAADGASCAQCVSDFWEDGFLEEPTFLVYRNASGACNECTANPVSSGCTSCGSKGECTSCKMGYALGPSGRCQACKEELCERCRPDGTCKKCLEVTSQYDPFQFVIQDQSGKCRICAHSPEDGCNWCKNDGTCGACSNMHAMRNGGCVSCSKLTPKCYFCNQKTGTCTQCETGYGLKAGRCVPCADPLCAECTRHDRCRACKALARGFTAWDAPPSPTVYKDGKGRCRQCQKGCATCRSDGKCATCAPGYRKAPGGTCTKCSPGKCLPCSDAQCAKCGADGFCSDCKGMYARDKKCRACASPGCVTCSEDHQRCQKCEDRVSKPGSVPGAPEWQEQSVMLYLDSKSGTCKECPEGCEWCDEAACVMCAEGWVQVGKTCKRCKDPLCSECDAATRGKCKACRTYANNNGEVASVFLNSKGRCQLCTIPKCLLCARGGACAECEPGHRLKAGSCVVA